MGLFEKKVPENLRKWFGVHFVVDVLVGAVMFLFPLQVIEVLGVEGGSSVLVRMIAAALFGIGLASWWGRKGGREEYLGMLKLKLVWSGMAIASLLIGVVSEEIRVGWGLLIAGVFLGFNGVWGYYYRKLT